MFAFALNLAPAVGLNTLPLAVGGTLGGRNDPVLGVNDRILDVDGDKLGMLEGLLDGDILGIVDGDILGIVVIVGILDGDADWTDDG